MRARQFNLEVTWEKVSEMGYGSGTVHLLFNLWYRNFNYSPAHDGNLPQIDHIFPQAELRKIRREDNPRYLRYPEAKRNQLANCMLLTAEENGFLKKSGKIPAVWFAEKRRYFEKHNPAEAPGMFQTYLDMHLIPKDPSLWEMIGLKNSSTRERNWSVKSFVRLASSLRMRRWPPIQLRLLNLDAQMEGGERVCTSQVPVGLDSTRSLRAEPLATETAF
jgi:hypothetical protein